MKLKTRSNGARVGRLIRQPAITYVATIENFAFDTGDDLDQFLADLLSAWPELEVDACIWQASDGEPQRVVAVLRPTVDGVETIIL